MRPVVASTISDVSGLEVNASRDVTLSGVFSDADGDALTVTATSSDPGKATATVAADQSKLTVMGVVEGTATITVTAQDTDGNRVSDTFDVSVVPESERRAGAPTVVSPLPDLNMVEQHKWNIYLSGVFGDPDGDELTYSAVSSNYAVASEWMSSESTLGVEAIGTGTATITVTAEDPDGNTVSDAFDVTVRPAS